MFDRQLDPLPPAQGLQHAKALALDRLAQRLHQQRLVVDDQHERPGLFLRPLRWRFFGQKRNLEAETAALSFDAFALHPDLPAVQLDQFSRQRETQTGALLLAGVGTVQLLELDKNPLMIFRLDSNSRIANSHKQLTPLRRASLWRAGLRLNSRRYLDRAPVGRELDRVRSEERRVGKGASLYW